MDAFIVSGARTPIGRYGGSLSGHRPDDLAALVLRSALERAGIADDRVDEVVLGCANQAGEDNRNVARMATLLAGLPTHVPAYTVNRLCASGLTAVNSARQMIAAGDADVVIAGGVESMTRAPWVTEKPSRPWAKPGKSYDTSLGWRFTNPRFSADDTLSMPETAERVAQRWGLTRTECDEFALRSHQRASAARDSGRFAPEIVAVDDVEVDEGPRANTSLEKLASLRPLHGEGGIITAGNASSLNDGAAAVVVASERFVAEHGLIPAARIVGGANAGVPPEIMGIGPVPATRKVLDRLGWTVADLAAVELNEAFASQSIACMRDLELDPEIVNADGGAIALGHPLGSSGTRILITLLRRLAEGGGGRGVATMCVGVGQGTALAVEVGMSPVLLVEEADDRVVVRVNRPEVRNALNLETVRALHDVCTRLEERPRPLILTGEGPDFVAGADVRELAERGRDEALSGINSRLFDRVLHLPQPVIGLLHGNVLGGGAELAYACDLRLAAPDLRIGNTEASLGIMPAAGATWRLRELVGEPLAKEMLLVGTLLDAEQALKAGLVMSVVARGELESHAHRLVDTILRRSAVATRLTKAVFHAPQHAHPVIDDIAQAVLFESDDKAERMHAFLERSRP